jgi:predicted adenylyl cyclase CyaB
MAHFEIEIKSLLGKKEAADSLKEKILQAFPDAHPGKKESQLNHYFTGGDTEKAKLAVDVAPLFSQEQQESLKTVLLKGKNHSIRTRQTDDAVLLVVKASVADDGTSSNGVSRMEFESPVKNLTLDELDHILLDAGLTYQAKWSRAREEYVFGDTTVCLDKNAGYGYLAEFERVIDDESQIDGVKKELLEIMNQLGVEELSQDRLERMFAHYNAHWDEYYGTDNVFVLE